MIEKSSFIDKKKKVYVLKKIENFSPTKDGDQANNIFNEGQLQFFKNEDVENIKQRQIVGKLELFQKIREQQEKNMKHSHQKNELNFYPKIFSRRISLRNSTQKSQRMSQLNPTQDQKVKKPKNYDIVSKQQLLDIIKMTEDKIKINNEIENEIQKTDSLSQLKQNRVLNRFKNQQEIWEQQMDTLIKKSQKTESEALMKKSLQYREKVEQLEHIQAQKQQEGTTRGYEWYMTLRDPLKDVQQLSQDDKSNRKSVYQDPFNQDTYFVDSFQKPLEIIRSQSQSNSIIKSSMRRNNSLSQLNFKLPFNKTVQTQGEDLSNLQIEGVNVLQKEAECLKYSNSNERFRFYKFEKESDVNA